MQLLRYSLVFILLATCAGVVNPPPKAPVRSSGAPNVVIITLDTTRADRMGFLGSQRGLTPNLDKFAQDSVVFTKAFSHVPLTPPSHATILTGTYPWFNHVVDFGSTLGSDVPYLPDILKKRGYRTGAFISSVILDPVQGSGRGFDRGFDIYDANFHRRLPKEDRYRSIERRADDVVDHALTWLDKHPRGPYFLWLHFYDAHDPYDPPEPFKSKYASAPYDGEIAYVDSAVGRFMAQLRSRGLYDGTIITVVADHGEALGEHGETAHGVFLYDETIHVPLVVKFPKESSAGKHIETRAQLVDITPTVLQTLKVPIPKEMQGKSLTDLISAAGKEGAPADRPAYAETEYPRRAFGWSALRAMRSGKYLLIEAPRKELYDQSTDPNAKRDLASSSSAVTQTLTSKLDGFLQSTARAAPAADKNVDPEAQEKLNALGYVASIGDDKVDAGVKDTGADPKDKVEIVNLLHDAILDVEETKYEEAVPLLQNVLAKESGIPIAYMQLGTAYTWLGQFDKAIPVLQKAVEMRPDTLMSQYELGLSLSETGEWEKALPHFQAAVEKSPKWAALHYSLAAAYGHMGRMDDARKELQTTLTLNPDDYRANLILGGMMIQQGKPAEGVSSLKKAARLQPNAPEPHQFLAEAYGRMGQKANAEKERLQAERLRGASAP